MSIKGFIGYRVVIIFIVLHILSACAQKKYLTSKTASFGHPSERELGELPMRIDISRSYISKNRLFLAVRAFDNMDEPLANVTIDHMKGGTAVALGETKADGSFESTVNTSGIRDTFSFTSLSYITTYLFVDN